MAFLSAFFVCFGIALCIVLYKIWRKSSSSASKAPSKKAKPSDDSILVLYASQAGRAQKYAEGLTKDLKEANFKVNVMPMSSFDVDARLPQISCRLALIISTYSNGTPPDNGQAFHNWLVDMANDHRVPTHFLKGIEYSVFGLGNSLYSDHYNTAAKKIDESLRSLGATSTLKLGLGDEDSGKMDKQFSTWSKSLIRRLDGYESDSDDESEHPVTDLEDLGLMAKRLKARKGEIVLEEEEQEETTAEMLTPKVRSSLTKQGYKLIGSHSGVKLCRWTKAMLRGRGGCYKHTFYGITSYQCMEMTPSLACANKCVFCWRAHTNPVAKEWKWKVDSPQVLIEQAVEKHRKMIKTLRGVPGVSPERFEEAKTIKHCALSLVGEPIIYPHINEYIDMLHERHISSFMVTNAQFPEKVASLKPVTQMYLSIDASSKEKLQAVDRPLFSDFWERFLSSIKMLATKGQRTVFRLTLIKQWNMEEMKGYAELVKLGQPDFLEVKGVTYCGDQKTNPLTMKNVPYHTEVVSFTQKLCDIVAEALGHDDYVIASEHEHSCCVLVARKSKFFKNNKWHTWIDYDEFHSLVDNKKEFAAEDYMAETPHWAVFGAEEKGFDPVETRFRRKQKKKPTHGC